MPMLKILVTQILTVALLISGCTKMSDELILFDSESDQELDRVLWQCKTMFSISGEHVTHGGHSLKMDLYPSDYPGISFKLGNTDWRRYGSLAFDIFNPHENSISLSVRIDDHKNANDHADRYNSSVTLHTGKNSIRIPLSSIVTSGAKKPLDLKTITNLMLFLCSPTERRVLYLDNVRLEH